MLLEVNLSSEEPIYRQIRTQVVHAVATGELSPGDADEFVSRLGDK